MIRVRDAFDGIVEIGPHAGSVARFIVLSEGTALFRGANAVSDRWIGRPLAFETVTQHLPSTRHIRVVVSDPVVESSLTDFLTSLRDLGSVLLDTFLGNHLPSLAEDILCLYRAAGPSSSRYRSFAASQVLAIRPQDYLELEVSSNEDVSWALLVLDNLPENFSGIFVQTLGPASRFVPIYERIEERLSNAPVASISEPQTAPISPLASFVTDNAE